MGTKTFISILVGILILGLSIGGAFIGGLTIGKGQQVEASALVVDIPQPPQTVNRNTDQANGQQSMAQIREQFQSGNISQEQMQQIQQQMRSRFGQGGGGSGEGNQDQRLTRGGLLVGTVEKVEGKTVTVNTTQGPLLTTVNDDTTIQKTSDVPIGELAQGTRIRVTGTRTEDGAIQATMIFIVPEGEEAWSGAGFNQRRSGAGGSNQSNGQ